jgi:hypothetical protein
MRIPKRSFEKGEGNLGCIFWVLVLAVAVMAAWKMVPVKMASAELESFMEEQAKFAEKTPPEAIKKAILRKAEELELPLDPKNLTVERSSRKDHISMSAEYTVPVEFPGYTYEWHFHPVIKRDIYMF